MRTGQVIMTARAPGNHLAVHPADSAGVRSKPPAQAPGLADAGRATR